MVQYKSGRKSPWMVQWRESGNVKTASFAKKEDAEDFEGRLHREKRLKSVGLEKPTDGTLFIDLCANYLKRRYASSELAKSTVDGENRRLRLYWIPEFASKPVTYMTTAEIEKRLNTIQFDLKHSPADRNRHRALLHTLFKFALKEKKVLYNPVSNISLLPENPFIKKNNRIKDEATQDAYLNALFSDRLEFGIIGTILLWTGCRVTSALACKWEDVDFNLGIIYIRRIIDRSDPHERVKERQKGKEDGEETIVPLFPKLKVVLQKHKLQTLYKKPTDFIAAKDDGDFIPYETFLGAHNRAMATIELEGVSPHGLRKTFATNAKKAGYTRSEIRELINVSSDQVLKRYDLKDVDHLSEKAKRLGFGKLTGRKKPVRRQA